MSNSRRLSLSGSANSPQLGGSTQDLKHRVIACLNKLADRDTLAIAAAELESIARTLTQDSFSPFLSCIHNTDDSSKTPVRKHCVSLLALLSESHGESLAPFLSRMIATVLRRIRDHDTAVRSACVDAVAAMSARITRPPFAAAFVRPLVDAMATEQDAGAQIGAAMCLSAAIEAAPEPDASELRRSLSRIGKLARSEGFKAKAAVLALIGSVVGAGGGSSAAVLDWLVPNLVEFLSSEDWAVRKAAAEALGRVAAAERDLAEKYRDSCLISLESRRFDKVKVVRETMNQTMELWKDVSSIASEEIHSPTQSRSSTDNGISGCFPPISKSSQDSSFKTPRLKKKPVRPTTRSPQSDFSDRSSSSSSSSSAINSFKKSSPKPTARSKKKPSPPDWKIEIAVPRSPSSRRMMSREDNAGAHRFGGGSRSGSRVVPYDYDDEEHDHEDHDCYDDEKHEDEAFESQKDAEDLSLICEQLLQIENQQSSLLELLQRFIGSSQSGLNSLETRVNGIEMALEEISYNMAVPIGRIGGAESASDNSCFKLPGADFLSSKLWRRAEVGRYSCAPRFLDSRRSQFHHQNDTRIGSNRAPSDAVLETDRLSLHE